MGLPIAPHAYARMRDKDILPGEADAVLEDPHWQGTRVDGSEVYSRDGLVVIVKSGTIVTVYRLNRERRPKR